MYQCHFIWVYGAIQVYEIIEDEHKLNDNGIIDIDIYSWPIVAMYLLSQIKSNTSS